MEDFISFQIYEAKMDAAKYLSDLIKIAKQTTGVEVDVNVLPSDLNDGIVKILGELPQGKKKKFIDAAEDYIDKHNLVDAVSELSLKTEYAPFDYEQVKAGDIIHYISNRRGYLDGIVKDKNQTKYDTYITLTNNKTVFVEDIVGVIYKFTNKRYENIRKF